MKKNKERSPINQDKVIGVVGLGYVGLPVAIAFAEKYPVIGYDIDKEKILALKEGKDETGEVAQEQLSRTTCVFTFHDQALSICDYIIIAVPTPLDHELNPDLSFVEDASKRVGQQLKEGAIVIYESTVYPGATEEVCLPILEKYSGKKVGKDFSIGYSPERINPGDKVHTFKTIGKVIAGYDKQTLVAIEQLYASVLTAPVYCASSIKVAEAAKIVENTQRDLNIAYMNELARLFHQMDIPIYDVLEVAKTKWNFTPFVPGLVGGHCIGVDPYYLIKKAEQIGYVPHLLKEARKVNESMVQFIVNRVEQFAIEHHMTIDKLQINILGITFKEDVPDLRNAKAIEIVNQLRRKGATINICDPWADANEVEVLCGESLTPLEKLPRANVSMILVPHQNFCQQLNPLTITKRDGLFIDLKATFADDLADKKLEYWTL
ncbi:nucleotide sugar dehydrogenase [Amphibacillus sediminis]|uniref:nucleotide sugar dehydrogenase n=1 Tax=Amphibacillus sediminis TaxID=360185 RepID=UPI00083352C7|nr:nucleotide sugar dehydrogenase [Amphibacillus sediminis]